MGLQEKLILVQKMLKFMHVRDCKNITENRLHEKTKHMFRNVLNKLIFQFYCAWMFWVFLCTTWHRTTRKSIFRLNVKVFKAHSGQRWTARQQREQRSTARAGQVQFLSPHWITQSCASTDGGSHKSSCGKAPAQVFEPLPCTGTHWASFSGAASSWSECTVFTEIHELSLWK